MESQIAPIEERVKAMVVDIVRTCQSTVAHNYQLTIAPTSSANQSRQPSSPAIASVENTVRMYGYPDQTSGNGTVVNPTINSYPYSAQLSGNSAVGNPLEFFREPPHLNAEAGILFPTSENNDSSLGVHHNQSPDPSYALRSSSSVARYHNQSSDSGYASLSSSCGCSCHDYSNAWNTANG